jgi:predicted NBD/HSP70 family sugar kinase
MTHGPDLHRRLLDALADASHRSAEELAHATASSAKTVKAALHALVDAGVVSTLGRRGPYAISARAAHVVGVVVTHREVMASVADLHGHIVGSASVANAGRIAPAIVDAAHGALTAAGGLTPRSLVVGCNPALRSRRSPMSDGHDDEVGLAYELRDLVPWDLAVEDDAHLAALGERRAGAAQGHDNVALLQIGSTVGLGIIVNGALMRGARGLAGDIGHLPLGPDGTGRPRARGTFELMASCSGLRLTLVNALDGPGETTLTLSAETTQILDAAAWGDKLALRLVDVHAELIARAVVVIATVADPGLVLLAGEIGRHPVMLPPVRDALDKLMPLAVTVESATLGDAGAMDGAVAVGIQRARAVVVGATSRT